MPMTQLRRTAKRTMQVEDNSSQNGASGQSQTSPKVLEISSARSTPAETEYASPSALRRYWATFAFKTLLKIQDSPRDPAQSALRPAPKNGRERLVRKFEDRAVQQILDQTRTIQPAAVEHFEEVPRIRPTDLTPEDFVKRFYQTNQPVVIDGLIKDSKAVRDWTLPWFKQHYGSKLLKVIDENFTKLDTFTVRTDHISIAEAVDRMLAGEPTYINNYSGVFTDHPKLFDEIDPLKIRAYTPALVKDPTGLNLFMGGKGTGSPLHCASGGNFFCMIHGEKKWTLAHPDFTPYMYPTLHPDGLYAASSIQAHKSYDQLDEEGYRLWRHVPKYRVHLKEGDVYFNPQWWWHMVENPTDTSIGIAVRVGHRKLFIGNPVFQALILSRPRTLKISARWMITRRPMRDEDLLQHIFKETGNHAH